MQGVKAAIVKEEQLLRNETTTSATLFPDVEEKRATFTERNGIRIFLFTLHWPETKFQFPEELL